MAPLCGDGVRNPEAGEECDDGQASLTGNSTACSANCTLIPLIPPIPASIPPAEDTATAGGGLDWVAAVVLIPLLLAGIFVHRRHRRAQTPTTMEAPGADGGTGDFPQTAADVVSTEATAVPVPVQAAPVMVQSDSKSNDDEEDFGVLGGLARLGRSIRGSVRAALRVINPSDSVDLTIPEFLPMASVSEANVGFNLDSLRPDEVGYCLAGDTADNAALGFQIGDGEVASAAAYTAHRVGNEAFATDTAADPSASAGNPRHVGQRSFNPAFMEEAFTDGATDGPSRLYHAARAENVPASNVSGTTRSAESGREELYRATRVENGSSGGATAVRRNRESLVVTDETDLDAVGALFRSAGGADVADEVGYCLAGGDADAGVAGGSRTGSRRTSLMEPAGRRLSVEEAASDISALHHDAHGSRRGSLISTTAGVHLISVETDLDDAIPFGLTLDTAGETATDGVHLAGMASPTEA